MELWRGALPDFVRSAESHAIAGEMIGRFYQYHLAQPSATEVRSWENSLAAMAGVARGGMKDTGVVVEYHLPLSGQRIDAMFFGHSQRGDPSSVVVELKQWSSVGIEDEFALNVLVDGIEHTHPCQQALDYVGFLQEVHSAYVEAGLQARACAFCHNLKADAATVLKDERFASVLATSRLFLSEDGDKLAQYLYDKVGQGAGIRLMESVSIGRFKPGKKVLDCLDAVLNEDEQWHLLDSQREAYNAILARVRRLSAQRGRRAVLVRGGPGTGKTVIAVQLLADALRLGFSAAHSTGGKAFTTALRSKFNGADRLFVWNMSLRNAPFQGLDLLLVDEAHRIRETSDHQFTPSRQRNRKAQVEELLDASKVTVFLLDEHQFVRPDEIGRSALIREATTKLGIPLKEYNLGTQFRCGGCIEYVEWVDYVLGFQSSPPNPWHGMYRFEMVTTPEELDLLLDQADAQGESARIVAGFCWKWSKPLPDGGLIKDVVIGDWRRPWNRKRDSKKRYTPQTDPYTLWAETDEGKSQVGCTYSVQGFEFDRVGVIWGPDLLWRGGRWISPKKNTYDPPLRRREQDEQVVQQLVRNAYRVMLTRGIKGTRLLCLDAETRAHIKDELRIMHERAMGSGGGPGPIVGVPRGERLAAVPPAEGNGSGSAD